MLAAGYENRTGGVPYHPLCGAAQQERGKSLSCRTPANYQVGSKDCCLIQDLLVGNAGLDIGRTDRTCALWSGFGSRIE